MGCPATTRRAMDGKKPKKRQAGKSKKAGKRAGKKAGKKATSKKASS